MNKYNTIIIPLLSCISFSSQSESLQNIANIALKNDYNIEVLKNNYLIELEKNNEIKGNYLPQVGLSGSVYENFYEKDKNNKEYSNATNANVGINLSYDLYDGAEEFYKKIQDNQTKISYNSYMKYKQELTYNVSKIYYNILANKKILEVENENKKAVQKEYEKIKNMVEVGLRTNADLAETQADLDLSIASILSAENNLKNSLVNLFLYTGIENIQPDDVDYKTHKKNLEDLGYDYWMKILQENNFDIKNSKILKDISKDNIKLNQTEDDFKVKVKSTLSSNYNNRYVDEFESQADIGFQIDLPIYNGGTTNSKVEQSRIDFVNSSVKQDLLNRQLIPQLRSLINDLESIDSQVEALKASVKSTQKSLEVVQEGYNVGIRDIVDVLDANTKYYVSLKNLSNAQYDYLFKQNELLYLTGMLNINNL
tara:strand:+ start:149704 stop:150981 length:1278 start_codon:yes stop_codon:yes gene_type:complete